MLARLLPLLLATTTAVLAQTDRAKYLASSDTIRGVNLGGWLLTERWYALVLASPDDEEAERVGLRPRCTEERAHMTNGTFALR
jgi:hypothetical protein